MFGRAKMTAQHGTNARYAGGCRCDDCKKAHSDYQKRHRKDRLPDLLANPNHPAHGTVNGHKTGCRCDKCNQAMKMQRVRLSRKARVKMESPDSKLHGTNVGYWYGCRCDDCRRARHDYYIARKNKKEENHVL